MKTQSPLSFEIDAAFAAQIKKISDKTSSLSLSDLIYHAIDKYDFSKATWKNSGERQQFSVRLDRKSVV